MIFSHQVSLPSMIYEHDCDTQLPNNIFDDEFHPGSKELPPSRPLTEPTPISYMIAKSRLCNELGNILQVNNGIGKHVPYDEIIRFDAKLRQIMQELPPHLKLTSLEGAHDPVPILIAQFNVDILCQKIFCLLHRKYMPRARQNARYAHSRRSAIEASLRALEHLATLHRQSQPGGRLESIGWYVKSIATKDFTLPAMLVMLELHYDNMEAQSAASRDQENAFLCPPQQRTRMLTAVETAGSIWQNLAHTSMEALKASKVLEVMLQKIKNPEGSDNLTDPMQADVSLSDVTGSTPSNTMAQNISLPPVAMPDFGAVGGMDAFATLDSSAFMGMDFGLSPSGAFDFTGDRFRTAAAASPFPMMASSNGDPGLMPEPNIFDWVSAIFFFLQRDLGKRTILICDDRGHSRTMRRWQIGEQTRASRSLATSRMIPLSSRWIMPSRIGRLQTTLRTGLENDFGLCTITRLLWKDGNLNHS